MVFYSARKTACLGISNSAIRNILCFVKRTEQIQPFQCGSKKALRNDENIALAHGHIGRYVSISDQVIQSNTELLLLAIHVSNNSCLVSCSKISDATNRNQNIHQCHFLPVGESLRLGRLAYNP